MSLIKLSSDRSNINKAIRKDMNDNYVDTRHFLKRHSGKTIGSIIGLHLTNQNDSPKNTLVRMGIGALIGQRYDRANKLSKFKNHDPNFIKK